MNDNEPIPEFFRRPRPHFEDEWEYDPAIPLYAALVGAVGFIGLLIVAVPF